VIADDGRRAGLADVGRRVAALLCLISAYGFAATGFVDVRWLAAVIVSALVVATAASAWSGGGGELLPGSRLAVMDPSRD